MTLRIIVRTDNAINAVNVGGAVVTTYKTFDIDAPEIEQYLDVGGCNEDSFLVRQISGVEVILQQKADPNG